MARALQTHSAACLAVLGPNQISSYSLIINLFLLLVLFLNPCIVKVSRLFVSTDLSF